VLKISGSVVASSFRLTTATDPEEANAPFAVEVRRKLDATTDPLILSTAGNLLAHRFRRTTPDAAGLGRMYLERALQLDPHNGRTRVAIANIEAAERRLRIESQLRAAGARDRFDEFSDTMYAAVSALPAADRLFYLPSAAESAYLRAESIEFTGRDKPEAQRAEANRKAQAGWSRARQYAGDALRLAAEHRSSPEYGSIAYRANVVLGVLALRDGDRQRAVEYMEQAGSAPRSDALAVWHLGLRGRLVEYLLREGERDSVAVFLEKSAALLEPERERLLKDAAQIRAGIMPQAFQSAESRH